MKITPKHYTRWDMQATRFPYYLTPRPVTEQNDPDPFGGIHEQTQTKEDQASRSSVAQASPTVPKLRFARPTLRTA